MHQRQTCHELIHLSLFGHFTLKHLIYLQQLRMNLIQLWCGSWFLGSKNTKLGAAPESGNNEWSSNQRVTTCDNPNSFRLCDCEFCFHLASVIYTPGLLDLWETKRVLFRSWCRMLCRTDWDKALSLPVQVLVLATKDEGDIQRKWHQNNLRHRDGSIH